MTLAYRPWDQGDRQFVIETFLDSYRTAHAAGLIAMEDWKPIMGKQFAKVLARPGVATIVAYKPDEDSRADLYGWLAVERGHSRPLVVYVYVKQPYRMLGVARGLFAAADVDPMRGFDYACKTGYVSKLVRVIPGARWTPLAVRFPPPLPKNQPL